MEERELPVGWISEKLGNAVGLKTGPFGSSLHKSDYEDGATPVVNPMHIINGSIVPDLKTTVSENVLDRLKDFRLQEGDVVLGRRGEMGRAAVVRGLESGWLCGTGSLILRQLGSIDPDYLQRFLSSPSVVMALEGASVGSTMVNLNQGILKSLEIPIAPLNEQRRIAAKLDTTLAAVEACRQRLDGVAAILKRFRQAVLAAATSGELTREWREQRGVNPEWEVKQLSGICLSIADGDHQAPPRADEGIPFITISAINDAVLRIEKASRFVPESYYNGLSETRKAREDDILFSVTGSVGIPALVDSQHRFVFQRHIALLRPNRAMVLSRFLYFLLLSEDVNRHCLKVATGTAQLTVSLGSLRGMSLRIPSLHEQAKINERVQHFFTLADQLEARLNAARKIVDRLTPALLAKAFRGELVPQDPNDEPASVLLERLAATRRAARQAEAGAGKSSRRGRPKAAANPDQLPLDAAPVPPDFLAGLLRECGALSERALLAVSELEPQLFEQQLFRELERGTAREVQANGQVLLEAVG